MLRPQVGQRPVQRRRSPPPPRRSPHDGGVTPQSHHRRPRMDAVRPRSRKVLRRPHVHVKQRALAASSAGNYRRPPLRRWHGLPRRRVNCAQRPLSPMRGLRASKGCAMKATTPRHCASCANLFAWCRTPSNGSRLRCGNGWRPRNRDDHSRRVAAASDAARAGRMLRLRLHAVRVRPL